MAERKDEAAFGIVTKNQVRGVCVAKIIGGKFTEPLPRLAVDKAVGQPLCSQIGRGAKLRPNHIFAEVVKASRVRHAELRVFAQAGSQPGGPGFDRAYPNKIELDIVRLHPLTFPVLASVVVGKIVTKLPSETNLFSEMRPMRGYRCDKDPATAVESSDPSELE